MKFSRPSTFYYLILITAFLFYNCSSSLPTYKQEYEKQWKAMIQSQAWKESLLTDDLVASVGVAEPILEKDMATTVIRDYDATMKSNLVFKDKYHSLVSQSYFKIITEADRADHKLKEEYEQLNSVKNTAENKKNKDFKEKLELVDKKFNAHSEMLQGLKSWNIFSEKRTGDLEYFKKENFNNIYNKYLNNENDDAIIAYLVYKLADLYHFEN